VSIDRIKGGMVVFGFDAWDSLGFREQIGLIPKLVAQHHTHFQPYLNS
jgi:hypothetical protein